VILVKRGAHVTIVARDAKRLKVAEEELKVGHDDFILLSADL
jgi:short-subunit dehydrogenase